MDDDKIKTILLVEDEALISMAETRLLKKYGYEVQAAYTGEEAVLAVSNNPAIDLVLMDINLGHGMDGTQAAQQILQKRDLPLVFLSSHTEREVVEKTEGITSYGYIVKNSGETVLVASIKMAFRLFEARRKEREKEKALQASEERFRLSMEATRDGLWDWNSQTKQVYYSPAYWAMLGYESESQIAGLDSWSALIHPQDLPTALQASQDCVENRCDSFEVEFRMRAQSGEWRWIQSRGKAAIRDETGRALRIVGTHTDITERRQAEDALRENEARFRALFEQAAVGVAQIETSSGKFKRINQRYCDIVGYSVEEMTAMDFQTITHPDDLALDLANMQRLVAGEIHEFSMEKRYYKKNGEIAWVLLTVSPMWKPGEPQAYHIAVAEDISERKQAENALREREYHYRLVTENIRDTVWLMDMNFVATWMSPSVTKTRGFTLEEIQQMPLSQQLTPESLKRVLKAIPLHLTPEKLSDPNTHISYTGELEFYRKDGSTVWAEVVVTLLRNEKGQPQGYLCVSRDTHERKLTQNALIASEEKFSLVFHRAPLMIIIATLEDGRCLDVNEEVLRISGLTREEIIGKTSVELGWISPEDRARLVTLLQTEGRISGLELTFYNKDGSGMICLYNGDLITIGNQRYVLSTIQDITERKQTEAELLQTAALLQNVINASNDFIVVKDTNLRTILCNTAFARAQGKRPADLYGKTDIENGWLPEFVIGDPQKGIRGYQDDDRDALAGKTIHIPQEPANINGEIHLFNTIKTPVKDQDDQIIGVLAIARDITERRLAQNALDKSEARYRRLVEGSPDTLYTFSSKRGGVYYSAQVEKVLGHSAEYLRAHPFLWNESIHPEDLPRIQQAIQEFNQDTPFDIEYRIRHANGEWRWLRDRSIGRIVEEHEILVEGLATDITSQKLAEERLRESESNFRAFFETITDLIVVASTITGNILFANSAFYKTLGYTPQDLHEFHAKNIHPPEKRAEAAEILSAMFRGERQTCPLPLGRKDGTSVPAETRVWLGRWNGQDCIFGISKDLSAEQEAQQRFERLFQSNPMPMVISTIPDRRFLDVNRAFTTITGYLREEVVGKFSEELNLLEQPDRENTMTAQLLTQGNAPNIEMQLRCKDGSVRDGLFSGQVISSQGNDFFLTVMVDITERKRAEIALRESENRYRLMADNMADVVWVLDVETQKFRYVSPSVYKLRGYTSEEVLAQPVYLALTPESARYLAEVSPARAAQFLATAPTPISFTDEVDQPCRDGSIVHTEVTTTYMLNEQGLLEVVGISRDITERVRARNEMQRAYQEKQALLRELQHRAKNSFALITSMLNLRAEASPDVAVKDALSEMEERVRAMSTLYHLLYTVDAVTNVQLDEYCRLIVSSLQVTWNIQFEQRYKPLTAPVRIAAPMGLIATELLTNAIKHAYPNEEPGIVNVHLDKTATGAMLVVEDDGVGMPPNFDPQKSDSLGLMLVHALTSQVHGSFHIEQERGTRCVLEFPLE